MNDCKQKALFNAINYYYQAMMFVIPPENNISLMVRPKHPDTSKYEEDFEFDHRQYRYLLSVFADNLNQSLKLHRDCFGDMEYYPKYKISKEEQESYETSLHEIYHKYSAKLLKQTVYRNTLIKKSYDLFLGNYEKVYPCTTETQPSSIKKTTPSLSYLRKKTLNDGKMTPTLSSKNQTRKAASSNSAHDKLLLLSQTFKAFHADISMTLKLKTISSDNPESRECFLRTARSTISRNERMRLKSDNFPIRKKTKLFQRGESEGCDEIGFKGNQIIISDNRKANSHIWEYQKESSFHSKFCTRRVVAIGQPQKKAINDIQMLHMQSKNIDVSSVFWPPASEINSKPKLKRWVHSFS